MYGLVSQVNFQMTPTVLVMKPTNKKLAETVWWCFLLFLFNIYSFIYLSVNKSMKAWMLSENEHVVNW